MTKTKIKNHLKNTFWPSMVVILIFSLIQVREGLGPESTGPAIIIERPAVSSAISKNQPTKDNNNNSATDNTNLERPTKPEAIWPKIKNSGKTISNNNIRNNSLIIAQSGKSYPLRTYKPLLTPNDPSADQWWVAPTGTNVAWGFPAGAKQTTVAVIDSGFALEHQEFSGRWAVNLGESGVASSEIASKLNCTDRNLTLNKSCNNIDDNSDGIVDNESGPTTKENPSWLNCTDQARPLEKSCNRIDDDGNGYIDDWRGWDFNNFDNSPKAGQINPDGEGNSHGTMVAGVLGATGNNGVGIAGVNWNTKILPLQALDDDSYGNSLTVASAIYYAADRGVDIISISLGTDMEDPYLREAVLFAQSKNIIIVAAAGNDGCDCLSYPANYPEVIAVGASSQSDSLATFSNYGENLDITAPGQGLTTTYWSKANQTSAYATGSGTSFAAPFVSGVLAMMRAQQPLASWDEITGTLLENADRRNLTAAQPRNNNFGFGFIKTDRAVARTINVSSPAMIYRFGGNYLGTERIRSCENELLPGSFLYELTKSNQVNYTINRYEIRKAENSGWTAKQLFGVCVGLPTDTPDALRLINLNKEIRDQLIK